MRKYGTIIYNFFTPKKFLDLWNFSGFLEISWDFLGFLVISWNFSGFLKISRNFSGFPKISENYLGFYGISRAFLGYLGISMDFSWFLGVLGAFSWFLLGFWLLLIEKYARTKISKVCNKRKSRDFVITMSIISHLYGPLEKGLDSIENSAFAMSYWHSIKMCFDYYYSASCWFPVKWCFVTDTSNIIIALLKNCGRTFFSSLLVSEHGE